jgi:hypothetical protein
MIRRRSVRVAYQHLTPMASHVLLAARDCDGWPCQRARKGLTESRRVRAHQTGARIRDRAVLPISAIRLRRTPADALSWPMAGIPGYPRPSLVADLLGQSGIDQKPTPTGDRNAPSDQIATGASAAASLYFRHIRARRIHSDTETRVSQASLVAILHAPKTVHTTSQAAITATAMAVDSGTKYDESRSPPGPFTIP